LFFAAFREAVARLPAGLVRPSRAARADELARFEAQQGPLPGPLREFLSSFDGVDLFHESWILGGVGADAPRLLTALDREDLATEEGDWLVGEAAHGDRLVLDRELRIIRVPAGSDERWVAGTSLERWLLAVMAHERLLYGPDGEFAPEAFDDEAASVVPRIALRQAERAAKHDEGAADWHHERGLAHRRLGNWRQAALAFAQAATLDPRNGWPLFDEGRAWLSAAEAEADPTLARTAALRLEQAAGRVPGDLAARLWAWVARAALSAGDADFLARARAGALRLDPELGSSLQRAAEQARLEEDDDAYAEAASLVTALAGDAPAPRRSRSLPIASAAPAPSLKASSTRARRPPPAALPDPAPAARPARAAPPPEPARSPRSRRRKSR